MKITFGYVVRDGQYAVVKENAEIVNQIFLNYIKGKSFGSIADELTAAGIEYETGKTTWDKSRVKRVIENKNYLGRGPYERIVEDDIYNEANRLKSERNLRKNYNKEEILSPAMVPIYCGCCGAKMRRRFDSRKKKNPTRYCCTNLECGCVYHTSDQYLWLEIRSELSGITEPVLNQSEANLERLQHLSAEIEKDLLDRNLDEAEIKNKIFEYADISYQMMHTVPRKSMALSNSKLCSSSIMELLRKVSGVYLRPGDKVSLRLATGQYTGKELSYE